MQEIKDLLKNVIKDLYGLDFDPEITPAPDNIDADYSTNAPLKLAKDLHKSPMLVAEELENDLLEGIRSAAARSPLGTRERSEELAREPHGARPLGRELPKANGRERRDPKCDIVVSFPASRLSGDNGAMVAAAAYYEIKSGVHPTDPYSLNIYPRISIEN